MLKGLMELVFRTPKPPRESFTDPVLGELQPADMGWVVEVSKGSDRFKFSIGGDAAPDAKLLAHAHDILNEFESFKHSAQDYIASESHDWPDVAKDEVNSLEIDDIMLCWPDRPDSGMIYFRSRLDTIGLWRCDYIDRKLTGLGCDT